jgi:hypothetical protein
VVTTTEPRLLDEQGRPGFGLTFYAVNKSGEYGSASLFAGDRYAVWDGDRAGMRDCAYLYQRRR